MAEQGPIHALCLLSGGLDSQIAVCLLKAQGIRVTAVTFASPFFDAGRARSAAAQCEVPIEVVNFTRDIVSLIEHPRHGFGSCMNPCIDCHGRMLQRAGQLAEERGCHFLGTGEVLNQRPMSQTRRNLETVARESGYGDLVLRPLSAQRLPLTKPERLGWVDRSKLLSIDGRVRKEQFRLAREFGLKNIPTPAGGCLLTEPTFCARLRDLRAHEGLAGARSMELLRVGRHFRLSPDIKVIVGRDERDNAVLEGGAELYDVVMKAEGVPGPTALLPHTATPEQVRTAAAICARYSDSPSDREVTVRVRSACETWQINVRPLSRDILEPWRIGSARGGTRAGTAGMGRPQRTGGRREKK